MELYSRLINYFRKKYEKLSIINQADKSDLIKRMDQDLIPNGWEKRECETHVTYTREFLEDVSSI